MYYDYSNKTPLTEGGEGLIFDEGDSVIKIYKQNANVDMTSKAIRANQLMKTDLPIEVIKPIDIVKDKNNKFIGIKMPKVNGEDFKRLSNKKFVISNKITTKDILSMLIRFYNILKILHSKNIYIGDLNDQNILFDVKTKNIYLIDVYSWSIGTEKCEVAMDLFKDPKLVSNNFNAQTDIYSFCILAWKALTRVHPYGGTMNPDMDILTRMSKGISVIDNPKVKIPRTIKSWSNLSPKLITDFKEVFNNGIRSFNDNLEDMFNNLAFCSKCKDYYYAEYNQCPICDKTAKLTQKAISVGVENGFKISKTLVDSIVKTVYDKTTILGTDNSIIDLATNKHYTFTGNRYIFLGNNYAECLRDKMIIHTESGKCIDIPIMYRSYPISIDDTLYYISNKGYFCKLNIIGNDIAKTNIVKCSNRVMFNVEDDNNYCITNIYDKKIIINNSSYYYELDFNKPIEDINMHYDKYSGRWLIIIEDKSNKYYSYIIEKNQLKWNSNNITYNCSGYNVVFNHGAMYIPIDGAIRGLNTKTLQYKDFSCSVVSPDSKLLREGNKFIIVNDDNIYKFYK